MPWDLPVDFETSAKKLGFPRSVASIRAALISALRLRGHSAEWSYDSLMSRRIGFLIFDGLTALDLVGPFDTFAVATEIASSRQNGRAYDLVTVGLKSVV